MKKSILFILPLISLSLMAQRPPVHRYQPFSFLFATPPPAPITPPPSGAYIFSGGVWTPLTTGGSGQALTFTPPPSALYVFSGGAWIPWTGSGGGGGSVSITSSTGDLTVSPSPLTGTGTIDLNLASANTWTGAQTITGNASTPQLTLSGGAFNEPFLISDTSAVGTFMSLQGTDASVDNWVLASAGSGAGTISSHTFLVGDITSGLYSLGLTLGNTGAGLIKTTNLTAFCWTPGSSIIAAACDTGLSRNAAGVVRVGNGTQGDASGTIAAAVVQSGNGATKTCTVLPTVVNGIVTSC